MAHLKSAADQKAQDYWKKYYGEYGEMLVREMPRVIKAALLPDLKRQATAEKRDLRVLDSVVVPLGMGRSASDGVVLDGIVRFAYAQSGERREAARLIRAEFSAEGDLLDFHHVGAPAA